MEDSAMTYSRLFKIVGSSVLMMLLISFNMGFLQYGFDHAGEARGLWPLWAFAGLGLALAYRWCFDVLRRSLVGAGAPQRGTLTLMYEDDDANFVPGMTVVGSSSIGEDWRNETIAKIVAHPNTRLDTNQGL
jgi:hypothetical protein